MNENVGASFGLSLLVVGFFAVVLYHPDQRPEKSAAKPADRVSPAATTAVAEPKPASTADAVPMPTPPARQVSRRVVEETSKRVVTHPIAPRGAFTSVRAGERLEDVSARVYGHPGSAEKLWKANRDLLERADVPLRTGMLVRTP